MSKLKYEDLALPHYRNSEVITSIGGTDLTLPDIVAAGLFSRLNIFFVGEKGCGKTQLATDIYNTYFGGKGLFERGNPDFNLKDLYERINISKLEYSKVEASLIQRLYDPKEDNMIYAIKSLVDNEIAWTKIPHKKAEKILSEFNITTHDMIELSKNVNDNFFFIDELNRTPQLVQNQFLNVADGYIIYKGRKIPLGKNAKMLESGLGKDTTYRGSNYTIGIATANVDKNYTGTFRMDDALVDRFHIFLDFDFYRMSVNDRIELMEIDGDPRVRDSKPKDLSSKIIKVHNELLNKPPSEEAKIVSLYLTEGLNYCHKFSKLNHRKSNFADGMFPDICFSEQCSKSSTICGFTRSASTRAMSAYLGFTKGLEYIAKLKNPNTNIDNFETIIEAVRIAGAYSGIVNTRRANQQNPGKPQILMNEVIDEVEKRVVDKKEDIVKAMSYAAHGELRAEHIEIFEHDWGFMGDYLTRVNDNTKLVKKAKAKKA